MAAKKGRLGKGLEAIFIDNSLEESTESNVTLKISDIEPNRNQPRKDFNEESLLELADSISKHGLIQPILVRPLATGGYQIVAGERRWRACRMAGILEAQVIIKDMSDEEVAQIALIENLQRENLSPIEEALGFQSLMDDYNFTQEDVAKTVGKSRPAVTNTLRLLNLPDEVKDMVSSGELSPGHARALLSIEDKNFAIELAKEIVKKGLTVRDIEKIVKKTNKSDNSKTEKPKTKRDSFFDEVELALHENLNRKVKITNKTKETGILELEFYSLDDLKSIISTISDIEN